MSLPSRPKYQGETRKLLLAFDIGTTFSGISYRYPSQEHVGGDSKIPTVIYYDKDGKPCAIGAETLKEGIEADAEEKSWSKAYWFKLHLRPKTKGAMADRDEIPPLPPNKTVIQVFTDYMRYLHQCAKDYISQTHGALFWRSLEDEILYVLTHPNGWEGAQQASMRNAAILAGFIPDTADGRSRISFVTEGEASLHFCLSNGLTMNGSGNNGSGVLIVDAGGGTIDVTAYQKLANDSFEEIAIPKCYFQGSIYVTSRAEKHFDDLLSGTRFHQDVPILATRFDRNTKHVFRRDDEPHHIQFASHRERDAALNIRAGRITVSGRVVASFFEPSISCIIEAIKLQKRIAHSPIESVFLVGGFSASTWLFEKVKKAIEPLGIGVFRPDSHVNKAVSNGAVSFFLDSVVKSRISRVTYGARQSELDSPVSAIHSYRGTLQSPKWFVDEPEQYTLECLIRADTSSVKREQIYSTFKNAYYYQMDFDIVLMLGLTELKAQIAYLENGIERRGPATIIYEGDDLATWRSNSPID
ncbi:hypothetical protein EST38_g132 [Candolleomyces aberdarensis]|uniref:Uncharacterized protein n=1 Tax=Candolleomyces aberdarensis TaxID=2316362 RepID=A0A4Q2E0P2_9AGAR|nr:hypothetical protein EST38_g132 [Candolleomyces aberdarensis]